MRHAIPFGRPKTWPVIALDPLAAWAAAAALFLAVLAVQLEVDGAARPYPFLVFFPTVLLAAWLSGRGPAIAVAVAAALSAWWFLLRTPGILAWPQPGQAIALAVFLGGEIFAAALVAGLARNGSRARQAQARAETALAAQRVLSAELQHRVANNLQVVSSALTLQARRLGGTPAAAALGDATRRLDALGRLHRTLLAPDAPEDAARVLEELCRTQVEAAADGRVALTMQVDAGLTLDADRLTLLGMIASEAISNAMKHAFAADGRGRIVVRLQPAVPGRLALEVCDDGRGLPDGFDLRTADSLGLRIVHSMAQRLGGRLTLAGEGGGTVLRVLFPEPPAKA